MKYIQLAVLCLILLLSPRWVDANPKKITWLTNHWPPLMELDETSRRVVSGRRWNQLKMIQEEMPGYEHDYTEMRWNRFWNLIKMGQNICNCMAVKNKEREEFANFSIPVSLTLPNHIVVRKETYIKMGSPEDLSLVSLLKDNRYRGTLLKNRSYSLKIDTILAEHEKNANLIRSIIDEQAYIRVLLKKRVDYILEYPYIIKDSMSKHFPESTEELELISITEIDPYYFVYIACPKTDWGKTVMNDINKALIRLRPTEPFRRETTDLYEGRQVEKVKTIYDKYLLDIQSH